MTNLAYIKATTYFTGYTGYFWQWADGGRVLEFANGKTICYRNDLTFLLNELPAGTRAPLGTILLLLCACKDNWDKLYEFPSLLHRVTTVSDFSSKEHGIIRQLREDALKFLKVVNALPYEFRSGMKRVSLLGTILSALPPGSEIEINADVHTVLRQFNTGEIDYPVFAQTFRLSFDTVKNDLLPLSLASELFPNVDVLELKLRTGLDLIPQAAPVSMPEMDDVDLLTQLEADGVTKRLALLARRIMAVLHIPMELSGVGEQSLGGVADISNRGNFDKLLLSELAQDDTLLSARLANGEALFLQRELPPNRNRQELSLLIDITLKMWGTPRVVALATALALHESVVKNQDITVGALGGEDHTAHAFQDKNSVVALLEALNPALHCGEALIAKLNAKQSANTRVVWLTGEESLEDTAVFPYYMRVKDKLSFVITVSRQGIVRLYKLDKGVRKLLNQAQVDIEQLISAGHRVEYLSPKQPGLPTIMNTSVFPLYYPASKIKVQQDYVHHAGGKKVLVVTQDKRVLFWQNKDYGAVELLDHLPNGGFCIGALDHKVYIIVSKSNAVNFQLFTFYLTTLKVEVSNLKREQTGDYSIRFIDDRFYLSGPSKLEILDPELLQFLAVSATDQNFFKEHLKTITHYKSLNNIKKLINNGYSVINSAKSIYVHTARRIFMDKREFIVKNNNFIWQENTLGAIEWVKPQQQDTLDVKHLPNIKFTRYTWMQGSTVILDSRGLLHLKSTDATLPEVTIVLVVDQPTACWSSDGVVSGSTYFTGKSDAEPMQPALFYDKYIQPFINTLK